MFDVALIDILIVLVHEDSDGIEINEPVICRVKDGEARHSVEISLPFQSLLFFFYFNVVMHFFLDQPRHFKFNVRWQFP